MLHYIFSIPLFIAAAYAQVVNINVGQNGNTFSPPAVNATVGNTIVFTWVTGLHNVVQTNDNSCTNVTTGGFTSGPAVNQPGKKFNFTVTKTGNLWYACQIHCATGMKGLIVVSNGGGSPSPTGTIIIPTPTPTGNGILKDASLPNWITGVLTLLIVNLFL